MLSLQKQVGARLKTLRGQRGLSQEGLAGLCNLHRTYIGLIERGERSLSIPTIEVIARVLEIQPGELFQGAVAPAASRRAARQKAPRSVEELIANVATIRQVLIEAKLVDPERFAEMLKSHERAK
jgi:transcriptional regulator with XRE-family HTH domain